MAEEEGDDGAYGYGARPKKKAKSSSKAATSEVSKQKSAIREYWAQMTPEERSKEMKRRQRVSAKKGGKMVGFGINRHTAKRKLSAKSERAVAAALEEKRVRDAARKRVERSAKKAPKGIPMAARPTKPGTLGKNGRPLMTAEERAAKQALYRQRYEAKEKGLPLPPLPSAAKPNSASVN